MQRGTITILIIVSVAVVAAVSSVVYHYRNQQHAQQFWGTQTARLIDKAPQVEVITLGEADAGMSISSEDEPDEPPPEAKTDAEKIAAEKAEVEQVAAEPTVKALEFNGTPWIVTLSKDAVRAKGIANLRRALVLDTTYDWDDTPPATEPRWKYGLAVEDGHDWATVLFDFDSRQVGLAGGRHTALLNPEANTEFKGFFDEQFAASTPEDSAAPAEQTPPAQEAAPAID
jgi:hypothetical protein